MTETIFSKIVRGDIPCHKIYEDEKVYRFLGRRSLEPGSYVVDSKRISSNVA